MLRRVLFGAVPLCAIVAAGLSLPATPANAVPVGEVRLARESADKPQLGPRPERTQTSECVKRSVKNQCDTRHTFTQRERR
jgi:hypothetical protein